jgi:heme oxygenase
LPTDSLRHKLRHASSALHHQLDTSLGEFTSRSDYSNYVQRTHRFRQAVEHALSRASITDWQLDPISDLATGDLADLGIGSLAQADMASRGWTRSEYFGALYVIEGSSLGARLLYRRAQALGMTESFGARHLAHQAADHGRWRRFLEILETVPVPQHDAATEATLEIFRFALSVYREPAYEYA